MSWWRTANSDLSADFSLRGHASKDKGNSTPSSRVGQALPTSGALEVPAKDVGHYRGSFEKPIIHVGFAHSGTTSLQDNVFSQRRDLFYAGVPYGELGGLFSWLKYQEDEHYSYAETALLRNELILAKMTAGQRLVLSDETFVDQPAIYYTPAMMPVAIIAELLRALFGDSIVLFTIRNQPGQVISNYNVMKRNAKALAGREIEPFDAWFAGNCTQVRNLFLRNLDPSHAIKVYQRVFGENSVQVLPLELLVEEGVAAYLERLGRLTGLEITPAEIERYVPRNVSLKTDIALTDEQLEFIRRRSAAGNAFVADRFQVPLREYGYPMPDPILQPSQDAASHIPPCESTEKWTRLATMAKKIRTMAWPGVGKSNL